MCLLWFVSVCSFVLVVLLLIGWIGMLAVLFVCFGFGLVFLLWYVGVGCYLGFSVGICCLDFCLLFKL